METQHNWNKTAVSQFERRETPRDAAELTALIRDDDVPSPVRAVGGAHSMNACFATTGTQVYMSHFRRLDAPDPVTRTITVGAGVTMLELRDRLAEDGWETAVMPEIGNATVGSVACCGTKDSSLQDPSLGDAFGQVSSTVVGVRMIGPGGADLHITSGQPAGGLTLEEVRSSYGLLGIVYEATFAIRPLRSIRYEYREITFDPEAGELPGPQDMLRRADGSRAHGFLAFLQPFANRVLVEQRTLVGSGPNQAVSENDVVRDLRGVLWEHLATIAAEGFPTRGAVPFDDVFRDALLNGLGAGFVAPRGQSMIDFSDASPMRPERAGAPLLSRFTDRVIDGLVNLGIVGPKLFDFTFWAIPQSAWKRALGDLLRLLKKEFDRAGFRPSLPVEVYFIEKDTQSLLSFSHAEPILTFDMVHSDPAEPRWRALNARVNEAIAAGGYGARPLLNQTKELTAEVVAATLGADWTSFVHKARQLDQRGRFRNRFFVDLGA